MKKNSFDRMIYILIAVILALAMTFLMLGAVHTAAHADGRSWTQEEAEMLARCVWGEYRGYDTDQVAAVVWCILNRVDDERFPNTIQEVITAPYQFSGYSAANPLDPRIQRIVYDVLARWSIEGQCVGRVGRVLPSEYVYFTGNGRVNLYRAEYASREYWDWSWDSPYEVSADE